MSLVKDCFDDPTVTVSLSPRELSLILTALNMFDDQVYRGDISLAPDTHQRWDNVLDYIKDETLANGYAVKIK